MKVLKFGGTSVGKPERMQDVAAIISSDEERKIVVLSAVSGTTNSLVAIDKAMLDAADKKAITLIEELYAHYIKFITSLFGEPEALQDGHIIIDQHFEVLRGLAQKTYEPQFEKEILAQGELISTKLFTRYLKVKNIEATLLPALEFMSIDENHEPEINKITSRIKPLIDNNSNQLFITQGYICRNETGAIDNLKRGGSDYSASLIGAAIGADEIQIWTDIDGMHNNDPRIVDKTFPVARLSYDEAAELSYFGAKILHPASIWPAQKYDIPVRLLNTMQPAAKGTYISRDTSDDEIKAIAAKDNISAIKIKSSRMLLAYGFLRQVFEVFERHKTPIDMITTSEVAVSLTIDDDHALDKILNEIKAFGHVEVDSEQTIICIVGALVAENKGIVSKLFDSIDQVPIRMISYGGSKNNISLLIDTKYKKAVLDRLNIGLFSIDLIDK